ncbi:Uncharacterised protein [Mycobacteroides abscessus subsp. abscessus]|nr:Uncharacterised protein [Mycobacteroides abscessus subsp. abscessus]SKU22197.1 Uncharacterised protein [Mycobacteroides abscessus subsp. abscessus]
MSAKVEGEIFLQLHNGRIVALLACLSELF